METNMRFDMPTPLHLPWGRGRRPRSRTTGSEHSFSGDGSSGGGDEGALDISEAVSGVQSPQAVPFLSPGRPFPATPPLDSPHMVPNSRITLKELPTGQLDDPLRDVISSPQHDFGDYAAGMGDLFTMDGDVKPSVQADMETEDILPADLHETSACIERIVSAISTPPRAAQSTPYDHLVQSLATKRPRKSLPVTDTASTPQSQPHPQPREHRRSKRKLPVLTMELSPILMPSMTPAIRRRRQARRIIVDVQNQISRDTMRSYIRNTRDIAKPKAEPHLFSYPSVQTLFSTGARKGANKQLFSKYLTPAHEGICVDSFGTPTSTSTSESSSSDDRPTSSLEPQPKISRTNQDVGVRQEAVPQPEEEEISSIADASAEIQKGAEVSAELVRDASVNLSAGMDKSRTSMRSRSSISESPASTKKPRRSLGDEDISRPSTALAHTTSTLQAVHELDEAGQLPTDHPFDDAVGDAVGDAVSISDVVSVHGSTDDPLLTGGRTPESPDRMTSILLREIASQTENSEWTAFHNICPPRSNIRHTAAVLFSKLVEQARMGRITVKQKEAFASIFISRGPHLSDVYARLG